MLSLLLALLSRTGAASCPPGLVMFTEIVPSEGMTVRSYPISPRRRGDIPPLPRRRSADGRAAQAVTLVPIRPALHLPPLCLLPPPTPGRIAAGAAGAGRCPGETACLARGRRMHRRGVRRNAAVPAVAADGVCRRRWACPLPHCLFVSPGDARAGNGWGRLTVKVALPAEQDGCPSPYMLALVGSDGAVLDAVAVGSVDAGTLSQLGGHEPSIVPAPEGAACSAGLALQGGGSECTWVPAPGAGLAPRWVGATMVLDIAAAPWLNELQWDGLGNVAVEVAAGAGTDMTGWRLEFYQGGGSGGGGNCGADRGADQHGGGMGGAGKDGAGNGCPSYGRVVALDAAPVANVSGSGFGFAVARPPQLAHAPVGGVALLAPDGAVVDFVAFEALFKATDGGAKGNVSHAIGAGAPIPGVGGSVALVAGPRTFTWVATSVPSWGQPNAGQRIDAAAAAAAVNGGGGGVLRVLTVVTPGWSGLMEHLIGTFEATTGIKVEMEASFDTFEKMDAGAADMAISHYKKDDGRSSAHRFVMTGQGDWPRMLYSNFGCIVGPPDDPAGIANLTDATEAIRRIVSAGAVLRITDVEENVYTMDILLQAAGGAVLTANRSEWLVLTPPSSGAGDGAFIVDAAGAGHYAMWGVIPFLKCDSAATLPPAAAGSHRHTGTPRSIPVCRCASWCGAT